MNHYKVTVLPDDKEPVAWEGDAVCFMDACLMARRAIVPDLGAHSIIGRTYPETQRLTAALPLRFEGG